MLLKARMSTRDFLEKLLSERILIMDGSMGALIYSRQPTEEDYRGGRFLHHPVPLKNCTEVMVLTQPRLIESIHRDYLEAGSDIVETCTFNATPIGLAEFALRTTSSKSTRRPPRSRAGPRTTSRAVNRASRALWPAALDLPTKPYPWPRTSRIPLGAM